jgi:hypothetical protein
VRPRLHSLTEEHHDRRIEEVDRPGEGATENVTGVGEDLDGAGVARVREGAQVVDGLGRADEADRAGVVDERRLADDRFEASAIPALAERPILAHRDVSEVAGAARAPSHQRTARDQAGADTVSDRHDQCIIVLTPLAVEALGGAQCVDVVFHHNWQVERAAEDLAQRHLAPAKLRGVDDADTLLRDVAGQPYAHTEEAGPGPVGDEVGDQADESRCRQGRDRLEGSCVGADDIAVDPDFDHGYMIGGDLHSERREVLRDQSEQTRGASAVAARLLELFDQAVVEKVTSQLREEGGGEGELSRQISS